MHFIIRVKTSQVYWGRKMCSDTFDDMFPPLLKGIERKCDILKDDFIQNFSCDM